MADWVAITDSQVDPDAPLTSELAYAWRDNPIAIAEGAVGAPRIQMEAFGAAGILGGTLTGTTYIAITGLELVKFLQCHCALGTPAGSTINIGFTNNGGSSWSSDYTIASVAVNVGAVMSFIIDLETGDFGLAGLQGETLIGSFTTVTVPSNCDGIRIRTNQSRPISAYFIPVGGRG